MSVLALVEHEGGQVDELSLQALSLARELAGDEQPMRPGPGRAA